MVPALCGMPTSVTRFYDPGMFAGHATLLIDWLPVNGMHNGIYILLGCAGLLASPVFKVAIGYCRGMMMVALLFVTIGVLPLGAGSLWGLIPLYGWNVPVHIVTVCLAYYFGFVYPLDLGGADPVLYPHPKRT